MFPECPLCQLLTDNTYKAASWLRWSVTGLSARRSGFSTGPVLVRFVLGKVALRQGFLRVLPFSPASIIPPVLILIFNFMLLLREGQTDEAWEPYKKQCCYGSRGTLDRKVCSPHVRVYTECVIGLCMINNFVFKWLICQMTRR